MTDTHKSTDMALAHAQLGDVFDLSASALLVVLFAKTKSPYYKLAVNIAMGAHGYREHQIDGATVHVVAFGRTSQEAARALSLMRYVQEWGSTQVFAGGLFVNDKLHSVCETLRCYQSACACTDHRAHCRLLADDAIATRPMSQAGALSINISLHEGPAPPPAPSVPLPRHLFPCRRAYHHRCLQPDHPATLSAQAQALAVAAQTAWCPFFDADGFRVIEPVAI